MWSRKEEEFVADFHLVSRRTLSKSDWEIFRFHFLLGADWKLCCRRLNIDRGLFFHRIYAIQHQLGRTFRDLEPYAMYPVDEYFGGAVLRNADMEDAEDTPDTATIKTLRSLAYEPELPKQPKRLSVPLRKESTNKGPETERTASSAEAVVRPRFVFTVPATKAA